VKAIKLKIRVKIASSVIQEARERIPSSGLFQSTIWGQECYTYRQDTLDGRLNKLKKIYL